MSGLWKTVTDQFRAKKRALSSLWYKFCVRQVGFWSKRQDRALRGVFWTNKAMEHRHYRPLEDR